MTTSTSEKDDGMQALAVAIEKIRETISKMDGGIFTVKTEVSSKTSLLCIKNKCCTILE